jgi:hypothetical protein
MFKLIELIIGMAILVHGYFYLRYGTADPCAAAMLRIVQDDPGNALAFGLKATIGRDNTTILECYGIALVGPKAFAQAMAQHQQQQQRQN